MGSSWNTDFDPGSYWAELAVNYPITGLRVYNNGYCEIIRKGKPIKGITGKKRGANVREFSDRSRKALARTVFATDVVFKSFMTITYPAVYPSDGKQVKSDLNRFLTWLRDNYETDYIWWLEFQVRGAPHMHILTTIKHPGKAGHNRFAKAWCKAQQLKPGVMHWDQKLHKSYELLLRCENFHRRPKQWEDIRKEDGARRYALMYALKPLQKKVPLRYQNVGRFWASSKGVGKSVEPLGEIDLDGDGLRAWLEYTDHSAKKMPFLPKNLYAVPKVATLLP